MKSSNIITTDASIYEYEPKSVVYPVNCDDFIVVVKKLISDKQTFTLRAGGAFIGGRAIGNGIVVDVSKYLTNIVSFSPVKKEVVVEPGVIQDDLNDYLKSNNLKFAPDT